MSKSVIKLLAVFIIFTSFSNINSQSSNSDAKSLALIKALEKVNGGWEKIASMKDVQYNYVYHDFAKGKDESLERYIFDGEASWGTYTQHKVHVFPDQQGIAIQCVKNGEAMISLNGNPVSEPQAIGGTQFLRAVNFYWFTMMYKLDDPGTIHKYLGQEEIDGINYDKVSLTYDAAEVGKEVNDEYILYFNPKTHLIDQIFFSVPAMGLNDPILRMSFEYELIDGIYIATKRKSFAPDGEGGYVPNGEYTSKNIRFNNGFTLDDLKV